MRDEAWEGCLGRKSDLEGLDGEFAGFEELAIEFGVVGRCCRLIIVNGGVC